MDGREAGTAGILGQSEAPMAGPVRSALIGAILAVDATGSGLALATICFAGSLAAGLGLATAAMLLATVISTLALAWKSGFRVALGITQDTSIAIIAPAVALAVAGVSGPVEAKVATGLAVLGASAVLSGLVFWAVGRFGLGRMVRLFPYPVAAGFLASSGALLIVAAVNILTGASGWADLPQRLSSAPALFNLLAAALMALCLTTSARRWKGSTPLIVVIFLFLAAFYAVLAAWGMDSAEAVALGLLPDVGAATGSVGAGLSLYAMIDWGQALILLPTLAAVVILNLIGVLLNISGVELATRADVDVNHELRVTGASNLVIGALGGLTSFMQGGVSVMVEKLHAQRVPVVLGYCAVLLLACLFAAEIVAAVPTFIAAGLLMFIGITMIEDWLVATRRQLLSADWALVCGIVGLTLVLGILPAIAAGLILSVLSFAVSYARLPVIRNATDAARRPSVVDRAADEAEVLSREGCRIRILQLQGAVFFGSVDKLTVETAALATPEAGLRALILDFGGVSTLDSAACAGLDKLAFVIGRRGITLHLANVSPAFAATFARWGLPVTTDPKAPTRGFRLWPTLDEAIQHCEEALLDDVLGAGRSHRVFDMLSDLGGDDPRIAALLERLEPVDLDKGAVLIQAAGRSGDVYVLETGWLGVYLPGRVGSVRLRLRVMAPGAIVGEVAHLLGIPRTADVVAETAARVWRMPEESAEALARNEPALFALWTTILARSLGLKLVQTHRLLAEIHHTG